MKNYWLKLLFAGVMMSVTVMGNAPIHSVYAAPEDSNYQTLPFYQDWSDTGLITTNDDWSGIPGALGYLGQDITTVTGSDPQNLLGVSASNSDFDLIANQINTNITNGGVAEFELIDPVVALQGSGTADAPYLAINLNTLGWENIRVTYDVRDIDGLNTDNAVQPVALHYRLGEVGNFNNVASAFIPDATSGPNQASLVTHVDVILPTDANNQPQLQIRIMTANAMGNDEWVGIDNISVTGEHVITLDGDAGDWLSSEKLGAVNNVEYGLTWDANAWYFSIHDTTGSGFGDADFFLIGIDTDPTDETTNTGGGFSNGEFCGAKFPDENKPDFIARVRQNSYYLDSYRWNGSNWSDAGWTEGAIGHFDMAGNGDTYEIRIDKTTEASFSSDSPIGFYLWQTNSSCEYFNAWPPENNNAYYAGSGTPGNGIFLFGHTRFQNSGNTIQPARDNQRVVWATDTLASDSTVYNFFGDDDVSAGNPWLRLTTTATGAGGLSCTVRAKMVGNHAFIQSTFTGIDRYVDFTLSNCTNLNVDVQMRYEDSERNSIDEAVAQFYHCATLPCNNNWNAVAGGVYTRDISNNYLLLTSVPQTQFSYWTIGDSNAPTALSLIHFSGNGNIQPNLIPLALLVVLSLFLYLLKRKQPGSKT